MSPVSIGGQRRHIRGWCFVTGRTIHGLRFRGPMPREGDQMITHDNVRRLALAAALLVLAGIIGWAGLTRPNNNAPAVWLGAALVPLAAAATVANPAVGRRGARGRCRVGRGCPGAAAAVLPLLPDRAAADRRGHRPVRWFGCCARPVGDRAPRSWPGLGRGRHPRRGHAAGEQLPRGRAHRRPCDRLVPGRSGAGGRCHDPGGPSCSVRVARRCGARRRLHRGPASQGPSNARGVECIGRKLERPARAHRRSAAIPLPNADRPRQDQSPGRHPDSCSADRAELPRPRSTARGRMHVAASCEGGIRYLTSDDGVDWTATSIVPGIDVLEVDPELTVDGDTLHLAFTRLRPDGGDCGPAEVRLGVIHQSRAVASGDWSEQDQIGEEGDWLGSFDVLGGVVHATVKAMSEPSTCRRPGPPSRGSRSPTRARRPSGSAETESPHRVCDWKGALPRARRCRFVGDPQPLEDRRDERAEPAARARARRPSLSRLDAIPGFARRLHQHRAGAPRRDLVRLGSRRLLATERITTALRETSLALDPTTSQVHLLVNAQTLVYFSSDADGSWTSSEVPGSVGLSTTVVMADPASGRLAIVGTDEAGLQIIVSR